MKRRSLLFAACLALTASPAARAEEAPPAGPVFCRYVPERKDDFAWENDRVAFRAYGPALRGSAEHESSGIDCWFKRTREPIINRWYADEQKGVSYHQDHGQGYDPYHVGSSRGCGGTGIWREGKLVTAGVYTAQRVVSLAPDEGVFELTYRYDLPDGPVQEVKRITLKAGESLFRSESTFTRDGKPAAVDVGVGVTTHDGRAQGSYQLKEGWIACWETIDGQGVGTGVRIEPFKVYRMEEIKSEQPDESHVLLLTHTDREGKEVHYAGFAWEGAGEVKSAKDWQKLLAAFPVSPKH